MIKIKRGLNIPLAGAPSVEVDASLATRAVALLGADYHGMKPTMAVQVGDSVKGAICCSPTRNARVCATPRQREVG